MFFKYLILPVLVLFTSIVLHAALPVNDDLKNALQLDNLKAYCSNDAFFSTIDATASGYKKGNFWNSEGKDIWFKFIAVAPDVSISASGLNNGTGNTLKNPLVAIYTWDSSTLTEQIGSMVSSNNNTTAYKGGLNIGETYYIRVSAEQDATGTFKLCLNNYMPPSKPGQDCQTASVLCSKASFTEQNISGAGLNNKEAQGTCLSTEANSAWYTWTAANDGTLTFIITPTNINDDIDWVLYDLGINGNCTNINSSTAIRCAAGSGVNCTPIYYKTGLDMESTDFNETGGCITGQDGMVKYIDMIKGYVYMLLIDNFSSTNNGFTISFDGTGEFEGPTVDLSYTEENPCSANQSFTFTASSQAQNQLSWNFGADANIKKASGPGPHKIVYSTPGYKTILIESTSERNCTIAKTATIYVGIKPEKPKITANKSIFCLNDTLKLSTEEIEGALYQWKGPQNFSAQTASITLALNNSIMAGNYSLTITQGNCTSEAENFSIPNVSINPMASFTTLPNFPGKFSIPIKIQFINQSKNANSYLWDFGDGNTSTEENPIHLYTVAGNYNISLRASTALGCYQSYSLSNLVLLENGSFQIPNSFSPNGDGINDYFNVNITNLKSYKLFIFNRYGEKLFSSTDIFNSWNGTWQGKPVPQGAYYYSISGINLDNIEIKKSGSITLIR